MQRQIVILNVAFLVIRLVGLGMAAHGAQKLFGWFGGHGLAGTGGFFEKLGFRPGRFFAFAAGAGEVGGGVLTAVGFGGPIGPALIVLVMIVAAVTVHVRNGYLQGVNGFELNAVYVALALALGYVGFGDYSLDHMLHLSWTCLAAPTRVTITFAVAAAIALVNVALRRSQAPT
jgi:putative oxidoreductase